MSEEQAQQLMQQMQMLETYFSDLSQRETTFLSVLKEATAAIESINHLMKNLNLTLLFQLEWELICLQKFYLVRKLS